MTEEPLPIEDIDRGRRDLLLASLLAAMPLGISQTAASPLNPEQTIIKAPDKLEWKASPNYPEKSVDRCALTGDVNAPGLYYTLIR